MRRIIAGLLACLVPPVAGAGLPADNLAAAAAYSALHGEHSILVWENGRTVYERTSAQGKPPPRIYSITKSLVSIGVFRNALAGGLSIGQPAVYPVVRGVALADLMNQTSGLAGASDEFYSAGLKDKQPVLRALKRGGGGAFVYGPSHWEVLAEEIRLHRGTSLERWLGEFVPGARPDILARWRRDDRGALLFSTGARMNARELLSAGREVLRGMGDGRGRWPAEVRSLLSTGTSANAMYALGFWLNRGAAESGAREIAVESSLGNPRGSDYWRGGCLSKSAPPDLLAMIGTRGQRVYVVPSLGIVAIRLGAGPGFSDAGFLRRLFANGKVSG